MAEPTTQREASPLRPSTSMDFNPTDTYDSSLIGEAGKDAKFRRYVHAIDKILQSFDTVNEWADVIGFLTRLAKILQLHSNYTKIPRKVIMSKRLAQCLNPALPSGVHQKTLEVYTLIFEACGPNQLVEDLPLWSMGLFPFLQNATMAVKPLVLSLYEKFYLPLGIRLKPALKGLILGILPSLEEDGNEFFARAMDILDHISKSVGQGYFFHCLWLSLIGMPHLRLAAVNYLLRRMPKVSSSEDVAVVLGNETSLLCRALSECLEDKLVLVQRGALELLVVHFPFKYRVFQSDDTELLIASATSVVLRKDMSLNRRLYSWLLPKSDEAPEDPESIRKEELDPEILRSMAASFQAMLFTSSTAIDEICKPYKVLTSIMDKPEIANPLLCMIFPSILQSLCQRQDETADDGDLHQAATIFMEMLDPLLVWSEVYRLVAIVADDGQAQLLHLLLTRYRWNDEESQRVHLPFLFKYLCHRYQQSVDSESHSLPTAHYLSLMSDLLSMLKDEVFRSNWHIRDVAGTSGQHNGEKSVPEAAGSSGTTEPLQQKIESFYRDTKNISLRKDPYKDHDIPLGKCVLESAFANLLQGLQCLLRRCIKFRQEHPYEIELSNSMQTILFPTVSMISRLSTKLNVPQLFAEAENNSTSPRSTWIHDLMALALITPNIMELDVTLSCLFGMLRKPQCLMTIPRHFNLFTEKITSKIWWLLEPDHAAIHSRLIHLLKEISNISSPYLVEETLLRCMRNERYPISEQFDRLGILWTLSEKASDSGNLRFSRLLFVIFDALLNPSPMHHRLAHQWFRTHVTSYSSVLDVLLSILLDSNISREKDACRIGSNQISFYHYLGSFNMDQVAYAFKILSAMFQLGLSRFVRQVWTLMPCAAFQAKCKAFTFDHELVYAEALVITSIRFMESEEESGVKSTQNELLQIEVTQLLCNMFRHSHHMNFRLATALQESLIQKMLFAIHFKKIELQPHLLELFRTITHFFDSERPIKEIPPREATPAADAKLLAQDSKDTPIASSPVPNQSLGPRTNSEHARIKTLATSPILASAIVDSLTVASNRPVLQDWLNFILASLPYWRVAFRRVLIPIVDRICKELVKIDSSLRGKLAGTLGEQSVADQAAVVSAQLEDEAVEFLDGLEHMMAVCLNEGKGDRLPRASHSRGGSLHFLTGYVSSVFNNEDRSSEGRRGDDKLTSRFVNRLPLIFRTLQQLNQTLVKAWQYTANVRAATRSVSDSELEHESFGIRIQASTHQLLETAFRSHPLESLESFIEVYYADNGGNLSDQPRTSALELARAVKKIDDMWLFLRTLDLLKGRLSMAAAASVNDKTRMTLKIRNLPDTCLLTFLGSFSETQHFQKSPGFTEAWSALSAYIKEVLALAVPPKHLVFPLFRLLKVFVLRLSASSIAADKKSQREVEDLFQKLGDLCILIAGKSWKHKNLESEILPDIGDVKGQILLPEIQVLRNSFATHSESVMSDEILRYFASPAMLNCLKCCKDQDKAIALVNNLVYYVIGPSMRTKSSSRLELTSVLDIMGMLAKLASTYRSWRREAWEGFLDPKFFEFAAPACRRWKIVIQAVVGQEKEKIVDLIGRISIVPSTTIFMSRDQEQYLRSTAVRRVAFMIYCGDHDQYVPYLPGIQEKVVEILKSKPGPMHAEAYLCLRVLVLRISPQHLSNFWPTVLTEMVSIFEMYVQDNSPKPETQTAFLGACKFLDYISILRLEAFQWHQWIFIAESPGMMPTQSLQNSSGSQRQMALADKLHRSCENQALGGERPSPKIFSSPRPLPLSNKKILTIRPLITARTITNKRDLDPFFRNISKHVYEAKYSAQTPDLPYMEELLQNDFLATTEKEPVASPTPHHPPPTDLPAELTVHFDLGYDSEPHGAPHPSTRPNPANVDPPIIAPGGL
ncbi:Dopey, N-terminal-domain-containing protein [Phlyctochytrium arcticum]|nr:Dopey, N-terminal-domain-containing protein [Phlyctochytrium arcticum]